MNTDYKHKFNSAIELCKENGKIAILSADTDKVKSYVYSSAKLPEMRGASSILDDLNQEKIKEILTEDYILFNKGGSILALVRPSMAESIKKEIELLYPRETYGLATITVVTETVDHSELESDFRKIIRRLSNRLKKAKEEKKEFPIYEVIPYARRCSSCRIMPASCIDYKSQEETKPYLCKSCFYKRKIGRDEKRRFVENFKEFAKAKNKNYDNLDNSQDLQDIEDEDGYIGVIYADGNEIGNIIENKLDTPWKFIEFSEKLYETIKISIFSAISEYIYPKLIKGENKEDRSILPFEIISIGGDDLFIILPANITFQVTNQLCKNIEKGLKDSGMEEMENITFSFGVTIAKSNFPIYYIYDLVSQLLKSAKKKAKEKEGETRSAIDFMVFKSQGGEVSSINEYREQVLKLEPKDNRSLHQDFKLTFRPYLMEDFDKLIDFVKKMNQEDFSKSKLFALRESIEFGKEHSILFYLYMMSRLQEKEKKLIRDELKKKLFFGNNGIIPWIKEIYDDKHEEYKTPIVDILEIYDFVKE